MSEQPGRQQHELRAVTHTYIIATVVLNDTSRIDAHSNGVCGALHLITNSLLGHS